VTLAREVDHITPKAEGGNDDEANLQALCSPCHAAKTKQESARGIRRGWGND
jgi:5-methylcytosine-specific restriction protein A